VCGIMLICGHALQDTCGRVLGGGVTQRFQGRILPIKCFIEDTWQVSFAVGAVDVELGEEAAVTARRRGGLAGRAKCAADATRTCRHEPHSTSLVLRACGVSQEDITLALQCLTHEAQRIVGDQ